MYPRNWTQLIVIALVLSVPAPPATADPAQWWPGPQTVNRDWQNTAGREGYERGYREGIRQGEQDARGTREFGFERDRIYRDGNRGYDRKYGSRNAYRDQFRRGFEDGYRAGFGGRRGGTRGPFERSDRVGGGRPPAGYQDPAFARGYSDGFEKGLEDARDRDRYDAVRHADYRSADNGYRGGYGSKDAYKNNYRTGFRQGYEQGYEQGYRDGMGRGR